VPNARQLLKLHRVRRRDRLAWDYGTYWLSEIDGNTVAAGVLSEIHAWLVSKY
jgi:hypothetical protein